MAVLTQKMSTLEQLLIGQRKKGQQLESTLSAAQDRIGGAERRARLLEEENIKIKGELQSWQEDYWQEETSPKGPISTPMINASSVPESMSLFNFTSPMSMPMPNFPFEQVTSQMLSGPSAMTSTPAVSLSVEEHSWFTPSSANMEQQ